MSEPNPQPQPPRSALAIVFLVVVIDLLGFGVLLPLLPIYAQILKAPDYAVGFLSSAFSLVQFVAMPLWGRLSDRIGRRPVLLGGLLGSAAFYALFGYAAIVGNLTLMFVARIGCGAASATVSTAQAFVADCTPPEKRTRGMALVGAAFGVGFTFGPMLGVLAIWLYPFAPGQLSPMPGFLPAALSLAAFAVGWALLPESLHPGARAPVGDRFDLGAWRTAFALPGVTIAVTAFFGVSLGFTQFEGTLSLLLDRAFQLPDREIYLTYFYIGLILVVAQGALVRPLAGRISDERMALAGIVLMIVGIALGAAALVARSFWAMIAVLPVVTTGYSLMTPSLQAMVSKRTPADRQGAVLGVNQSTSALARIVGLTAGPALLGVHLLAPYVVTAVLMVLVGALLISQESSAPPTGDAA